jgi:hypothetical protein
MYGLSDAMREDHQNLHKLDDMVTIAKEALTEIIEMTDDGRNLGKIFTRARKALLDMDKLGV